MRIAGLGEWHGVGIRFKGFYGSLRQCLIAQPTWPSGKHRVWDGHNEKHHILATLEESAGNAD